MKERYTGKQTYPVNELLRDKGSFTSMITFFPGDLMLHFFLGTMETQKPETPTVNTITNEQKKK